MPKAWFAVAVVAVCAMACGGQPAGTPSPSPSPKALIFRLTPESGVRANGS